MKVQQQQQFRRGFVDEHDEESKTCLSLGCYNRLRSGNVDLKSFIKPECSPRKDVAHPPNSDFKNKDSFHAGGTRWNPTEEQIRILEALYSTGIRTPTAHQIDHITAQLSNYGKIEGKNVFYWFQNHKARERQRRNRTNTTPNTTSITFSFDSTKEKYWKREEEQAATPLSKRKCTSWTFDSPEPILSTHNTTHNYNDSSNYCNSSTEVDEEEDGVSKITLHLFPLHPETR